MNRKTAIATAGTIVTILLAGSLAVAANLGILSSTSSGDVGDLSSTTTSISPTETLPPQLETVVVEEPVPLPPQSATPGETGGSGELEVGSEEEYEEHEHGEQEYEEHEHGEQEYEEHEHGEHEHEWGYEDDD